MERGEQAQNIDLDFVKLSICFVLVFVFKVFMTEQVNMEEPECLSVCVSVARHISATSEAIAITFDKVTASVSYGNASRVHYFDSDLHSRSHRSYSWK